MVLDPSMSTTTTKLNKSAWIREQPESMAAADVAKKAKDAGIQISVAQVYVARANARKAKGTGARSAKSGPKPKSGAWRTAADGGTDDFVQFKRLVLNIGIARAEAYLLQLKQSVGL